MERPRYHRRRVGRRRRSRRHDERRGTSASRGYGSAWQDYTARFLQKTVSGGRISCIACVGTMTNAILVDHIIPVNQDPAAPEQSGAKDSVFWPGWNHQPLCRPHHTQKTILFDAWYRSERSRLLHQVNVLLQAKRSEHEIRNWLLRESGVWSDVGWFDLNPDPERHMRVLVSG